MNDEITYEDFYKALKVFKAETSLLEVKAEQLMKLTLLNHENYMELLKCLDYSANTFNEYYENFYIIENACIFYQQNTAYLREIEAGMDKTTKEYKKFSKTEHSDKYTKKMVMYFREIFLIQEDCMSVERLKNSILNSYTSPILDLVMNDLQPVLDKIDELTICDYLPDIKKYLDDVNMGINAKIDSEDLPEFE